MATLDRSSPDPAGPVLGPVLGLALGGGAVLGFSHLGVLMALEEAAIPVHRLSGTSAGAIAAAFHAFGVSPARSRSLLSPLTWRTVSNFSRNSLGLLSNEPLAEIFRGELGDVMIEDAPIPLAIVAADVHTGETVVLREGPLAMAVQASAAIPGIYAPVRIGDRLLVDGGIVENVPVRPLREMGAEVAIAVTLGETLDFQPVRTLLGVLTNSFLIAVNTATRLDLKGSADLVIEPDLEVNNHWDSDQRDDLVQKGLEAGRDAIPRIRMALSTVTPAG